MRTKRVQRNIPAAAAFVILAGLLLPLGCRDDKPRQHPDGKRTHETLPLDLRALPPAPTREDVQRRLLPILAEFPMADLKDLTMDCRPAEDNGTVYITVRLLLKVREDLYEQEAAPRIFDEDRRAMNRVMNAAMLPDAHYLLRVGAPVETLTDDDRQVKPLPQELQTLADDVASLAERPVYRLRTPAQTAVEIPASLSAESENEQWLYSDISCDTAPLRSLQHLIPASSLPKDAALFTDNFVAEVRKILQEKIESFCAAAEIYIKNRENTAREAILRAQTSREEQQKAREQQAARKLEWEKMCGALLYDAAVYTGEWKRKDDFGKFTLRIADGQQFPESYQFVGTLSDTDLPQAELQITGRAEMPDTPSAPAVPCTVRIFNGRYDPDVPTAEVFDAQDGVMRLSLGEDGSLTGTLTRSSWGDTPDRDFHIELHLAPKKQPTNRRKR